MYIEDLTKFTHYIANSKRTLDEVCSFLILNTFSRYSPRAIFVGRVVSDGYLEKKCSFGFENSAVSQWNRIPLTINIPIIESIRKDEVLLFQSRNEFLSGYPDLAKLGTIDDDWNSCVVSPIQTIGAYTLVLHGAPDNTDEFKSFLRLIGHLLALHFEDGTLRSDSVGRNSGRVLTLTARQELIKDLLSKGFSNKQIAEDIGFSESLVRQETVAIYAALKISGRQELIKAERNSITGQE